MRTISRFFSLQCLVVSLASISALTTAYAVPFRSDITTLDRRAPKTVIIEGKVAELGKQISSSSHGKSTVWRLDKWDGKTNPGYVIKIYTKGQVNYEEIMGLKAVGQFVAFNEKGGELVMKEVRGKTLAQMVAAEPHDKRRAFVNKWTHIVAKEVALIARTRGILHNDINMNNVIVNGEKAQLIDWESFIGKGSKDFTDDETKIEKNLKVVWDSTGTPPEIKKSSSRGASDKKSASPRASPGKKTRSRASVKKSGSPKRRSPRRREVFYE